MRDILFVIIIGLCACRSLFNPVFGILTFICLSLLNPHSLTWNSHDFPFAQMVAVPTLIGYLLSPEPKKLPRSGHLLTLLVVWGLFGVSSLFADYPGNAVPRFWYLSKILLMVVISISLLNTEKRLRILLRVIALSLGFYGLKGGYFFITEWGQYMVWGPENSFLHANNSIGLALSMNLPILHYTAKLEKRRWLRWLMHAMAVMSVPAVIGTYSRGAWLGLGLAIVIIALRSRYRILVVPALAGFAILAIPYLPQRTVDRYDLLVNYEDDGSAQSRFWNWELGWRAARAHPLIGAGFDYYGFQAYERYFPEFLDRWPGKQWSCHSAWFSVVGEHGFPAFFLWSGLLLATILSLRRLRRYGLTHPEHGDFVNYANMLDTSLLSYMLVATFLDAAYFDLLYQLIGCAIIANAWVLQRILKEETAAEEDGRLEDTASVDERAAYSLG